MLPVPHIDSTPTSPAISDDEYLQSRTAPLSPAALVNLPRVITTKFLLSEYEEQHENLLNRGFTILTANIIPSRRRPSEVIVTYARLEDTSNIALQFWSDFSENSDSEGDGSE